MKAVPACPASVGRGTGLCGADLPSARQIVCRPSRWRKGSRRLAVLPCPVLLCLTLQERVHDSEDGLDLLLRAPIYFT
eukprot:scaffold1415_cov242-Pinguiococcus_pyrenoidosus.AAC.9